MQSAKSLRRQFPDVFQALENARTVQQPLRKSDFTQTGNTANSLTTIAEYQADRPFALRNGEGYRLTIIAYESFTTDGNADNQETFNLSYDIIQSEATTDLVLYEGGSAVSEDSIDYSANSFDYTDDGTNNTLHAYYVVGTAAQVIVRKRAPNNVHEDLIGTDAAILNNRDQDKRPPEVSLRDSPLQPVLDKDWKLQILVDAAFTVQWADDSDTDAVASNLLVSIPIARGQSRIPGLGEALRHDISART